MVVNCFLSFIVFLTFNCNFRLSFSFSYRSDVLSSSTIKKRNKKLNFKMKQFFAQVILITENVMWTSTLWFYVTFSVRLNEVLASSSVMQNKLILLTNKLVYNQFIFRNICKWLLISFFSSAPRNYSWEWNIQQVSLWHIFSNWYHGKRKIRF